MKNKAYLISIVGLYMALVLIYIWNYTGYSGYGDMSNFTNTSGWCGNNQGSINPNTIPERGCFTLTNGFVASKSYGGHLIKVTRDESGKIMYKLDGTILTAEFDRDYKGDYKYSSPYVSTNGTYSWTFCTDVEHTNCPLRIDFLGDSADKTATTSMFVVAKCTGGLRGGNCKY